jgi:hypothetical protein
VVIVALLVLVIVGVASSGNEVKHKQEEAAIRELIME